jgi:formylglycine-generating enzyme required for sulfatase activity
MTMVLSSHADGRKVIDTSWHPLANGYAPDWASAWGEDKYGVWVAFEYGGIEQRLRWIFPGRFMMGSPHTELDRQEREGPQHEVILSCGYWLAETACTQALWAAVMVGDDPSRFKGPDRPVERISWNDVQNFLRKLNDAIPGLALTLPTEAQWEYACRADSDSPFSFGDNITPEQVNYNGNRPYAGAVKGLYRKETLPVRSLPPNTWGLHEMHGNAWEWCLDGMREYSAAARSDPVGPLETGVPRVVRGGGWSNFAGYVRSASRSAYVPDLRNYYLGFRCARVQQR